MKLIKSLVFLTAVLCHFLEYSQGLTDGNYRLTIPGAGCGISKQIETISELPPGEVDFSKLGCTRVTPEIYQAYLNQIKQWVPTSEWTSCSASCEGGTKTRTRVCRTPSLILDPSDCSGGNVIETWQCNNHPCPIDGGWSNYTSFGICSVTCGNGTQSRSRTCSNPAPAYGGSICTGNNMDVQSCATGIVCPVNGGWSNYTSFGSCSVTCGNGTQVRSRNCTNPAPMAGGANCTGNFTDVQACSLTQCAVNGGWSNYTTFGSCSATCGNGTQSRSRTCNNPPPAYGGANCTGSYTNTQSCKLLECPVACGINIATNLGGIVTSQNYPNDYNTNTNCQSLVTVPSGFRISGTFTDFNLESGRDFLTMYDGNSINSPLMALPLTDDAIPSAFVTSGNQLLILMTSDGSVEYQGFSFSFAPTTMLPSTSALIVECGSNITNATTGGVISPNFPSTQYGNNDNCFTIVTVPSGKKITTSFSTFETESGRDYLYLYDGSSSSSPQLAQLSGSSMPPSYTTTGNVLFLKFTSDSSLSFYDGFYMTFTAI